MVFMYCHECSSLAAEHNGLTRVYATARGLLSDHETSDRPALYRMIKRAVEEARLEVELARLTLEKHQNGHAYGKVFAHDAEQVSA